ncbi:MAG: hypothetical protein BJ554DRAFT_5095, partial [Olpidium bornovanus]
NCWPNVAGDGSCDVNIEYELENDALEFTDVVIAIPIPPGAKPQVAVVDGQFHVDHQHGLLNWQIAAIDLNSRVGTLEFNIPGHGDVNSFFPVTVSFQCNRSYSGVDVVDATAVDGGGPIKFSKEIDLTAEEYSVV